jgi:hypothetical protein
MGWMVDMYQHGLDGQHVPTWAGWSTCTSMGWMAGMELKNRNAEVEM